MGEIILQELTSMSNVALPIIVICLFFNLVSSILFDKR